MKIFTAIAFSLLVATTARAQRQNFTVDADGSEVRMTLQTNHEVVNGTFHLQSGSIGFDRGTGTISGKVDVSAISGKTGNESRDKKMKKDVLRTDKYTDVTFTPTAYSGTIPASGDATIEVSGAITLLGESHPVTIPMQIHIDHDKCTAKAHFVVPYTKWGLKNPSFLVWKAQDDVAIDLNLVGTLAH